MMRIIIVTVLALISLELTAQNFNFGLIGGINEEIGYSQVTTRQDYMELLVLSPRVGNQHIPLGVFAEYAAPKLNRVSVTSSISSWSRSFMVLVRDYHPDLFIIPYSSPILTSYQTWAWSLQPNIRLFNFLNVSVGYELQYNYRKTEYGWDWQNQIAPNPNSWENIRLFEMMHSARFMDLDSFIHNVYVAAELRFWHVGLEYRTGFALGNNLVNEVVHKGNVFNTNYRLENHFLRLKVYFHNVGGFRFGK